MTLNDIVTVYALLYFGIPSIIIVVVAPVAWVSGFFR